MNLNTRGNALGRKDSRVRWLQKLNRDPRNDLVLRFLEITAVLNPKVIVIEHESLLCMQLYSGPATTDP